MSEDKSISVCLTIYNQEPIMNFVANSIVANVSENVKEIICVFDGCTDKSEEIARSIFDNSDIPTKYFITDDVWEVKANNLSFKNSSCPYILTIQDDMMLMEENFDQRLIKPFSHMSNILGVTARNAQDEYMQDGKLLHRNVAGEDVNSPWSHFYIRDIIVRGPVIFDHEKLREMNYLNEEFAPIYGDDYDLSFRAWIEKGYVVGAYRAGYKSPDAWGKTRQFSQEKHNFWWASAMKNESMVMERYADIMGGHHSEDIFIGDN